MSRFYRNFCLCSFAVAILFGVGWSRQPVMRAPDGATTTGHYIIALKKDSSKDDLQQVINKIKELSNVINIQRYTEHVGITLTVNLPRDLLEQVREFPEISHIEEEDMAFGALTAGKNTNHAPVSYFWFLDRLNQQNLPLDHILADSFNSKEERAVDVYVLDSGIQFQHSEFENRAKYAGYDPVDQYHFSNADYKLQNGKDCNGHGTLVASLIGGKTYGTARKVNLFSVRVLDCDRAAPWSVILDGLNFVSNEISRHRRPAIVSLAVSGSRHPSVDMAISTLHDKNVLVVASAGNSHTDSCTRSPSSNSQVLTVGASNRIDEIFEDSNYGPCVDIFAPGEMIEGAEHSCPTCTIDGVNGTSLAASQVCGIAAVYLSRSPLISASVLKQKVIDISTKDVLDFGSIPLSYQSTTPNRMAKLDCGGVLAATTTGRVLQSPQFPYAYPNSLECTWNIVAEKGKHVQLQFEFIKLEEKYDKLIVCNGMTCSTVNAVADITGDYGEVSCGYVSLSNSLTLRLQTDETTSSTGFKAVYSSISEFQSTTGCERPITNNALQLDVRSEGQNVGNRFSMSKDWEEFFGGRRQGLNLAVLNEDSGKVSLLMNFDTHSSNHASNKLAATIENIDSGALVVISASGQASANLNTKAKRAISTLGSSFIHQLHSDSSWSLVGLKGLSPGRAIETTSRSTAVDISTQLKLQPHRKFGIPIKVKSAGSSFGNFAKIYVDGELIEFSSESGSDIGLNVLELDENSGEILSKRLFNTHSEVVSDYSPSDAFVDFINALPSGRVVAIASKGDAITHLKNNAKQACENIGSRLITQLHIGGSWAIIGRKGAAPGTVPESASNCAKAQAVYYLPVRLNVDTHCRISVSTSGFVYGRSSGCILGGVAAYLSVNNQVRPTNSRSRLGRGISVAVIEPNNCGISTIQTFDTHQFAAQSDQLATLIRGVPTGQIVVAATWDQGTHENLKENAKAALESIGSALIRNARFRDAWAIIGRKGAARGSVPETHDPNTSSIGCHMPLVTSQPVPVSSCGGSLYPLNCRAGLEM